VSLYGEHVCSINRLVLTDEDDEEYRAFETMIATHDAFCSSKVMLCTFHAVWQPFKRDVYNLLPSKKSSKGKVIELTDVGKLWGEKFYHLQHPISNSYLPVTLLSANYLYAIFQHQVCVYRTKEQYNGSHKILSKKLVLEMCTKTLYPECINAIQQFQIVIKEKECYLAFYLEADVRRHERMLSRKYKIV
jgi:hypothetical protein